ncbi:hypothetical protein P3S68_020407 [Capsicum galapagoense]
MGIIGSTVTFMAGTAFGLYLCQNYNVPTFNQLKEAAILKAKYLEDTYAKSNKVVVAAQPEPVILDDQKQQ